MNITKPTNLEIKEAKGNRATVVIEPCYPGYGVTIGNSLRRVLLSSIEGSAITSIKIDGAMHEFSSLPLVKEDMVEMILNIKRICLVSYSEEPVILKLNAKGNKVVTAADIEKNSDVEIGNPDQIIATLTDPKATLKMELIVKKGRGYVTVDDRAKEKVDIGEIMIDSLFSPVTSVSFEIENMRVGDRTDYERLSLKIETNGTITPKDALHKSAEVLTEHFQFVLEETTGETKAKKVKEVKEKEEAVVEEAPEAVKAVVEEVDDEKPKKRGRPKKNA